MNQAPSLILNVNIVNHVPQFHKNLMFKKLHLQLKDIYELFLLKFIHSCILMGSI